MTEYDVIRMLSSAFERSPLQRNGLFECDSELIKIGDQLWALTMDEFSPEEDLFTSEDPRLLGANLAVATLSDLLAAGANPAWFMHAVTLPKTADTGFVKNFSEGISGVLTDAGCHLCGGDLGYADSWRFCGFAMGLVPDNKPLTRIIPNEPQSLWVTGSLGDANLAALTGSPTPQLELRMKEAEAIRRCASACIDTSGGLFDALWILHTLNPALRLEIEIADLPIAPGIRETAHAAGFPAETALLGGAGEYELLFALPVNLGTPGINASRIGTVQPCSEAELVICKNGKPVGRMTEPPPCPRDAASVKDHVRDVVLAAQRLFGQAAD